MENQSVQNRKKTHWAILAGMIILAALIEGLLFNIRSLELIGSRQKEIPLILDKPTVSADGNLLTVLTTLPGQKFPDDLRNIRIEMDGVTGTPLKGEIHLEQAGLLSGITVPFTWIEEIPHSQTVALALSKPTTKLEIRLETDQPLTVSGMLNSPVPLQFNVLRFLLILLVILLLWGLRPGSGWYGMALDLQRTSQKAVLIGIFLIYTVFLIFSVVSTYPDLNEAIRAGNLREEPYFFKQHYQLLTEALLQRSPSVLMTPPEKLAQAGNPYDPSQRISQFPEYEWDMSYVDGKYYVYFGVVPALTFYAPYTLLFHRYPLNDFAVLFFALVGSVGLVYVYTWLVKKTFPRIPAVLYFMGMAILLNSTFLIWGVRRSFTYELALISAFSFAVCGLAFNMSAIREGRISYWRLAAGCLLMACAVGCRPTSIFISVLNIPLLFPVMFPKSAAGKYTVKWKRMLCALIPYLVVGVGLMAYNEIRFSSPFEFGRTYQLSTQESSVYVNGSNLTAGGIGILNFVFGSGIELRSSFPFLKATPPLTFNFPGIKEFEPVFSVIAICPLVWLVFMIPFYWKQFWKKTDLFRWTVLLLILLGLVLAAITGIYVGTIQRYSIDFAWMLSLAGILLSFLLYEIFQEHGLEKTLHLIFSLALAISLVFQLPLSLGESYSGVSWFEFMNPALFQKISYFFMFWL